MTVIMLIVVYGWCNFLSPVFTSPAFSVAATLSKLETTGPGQIMVMSMPEPSFSDLRDSKYP